MGLRMMRVSICDHSFLCCQVEDVEEEVEEDEEEEEVEVSAITYLIVKRTFKESFE